jgi:hypothetical protein
MAVVVANAARTVPNTTKTVVKTYPSITVEKLVLSNEYGNVEIHTWNKKEVQIKITILAQAHTMKDARALAARITIADNRNDTEITCRTNISGTDTVAQMKGPNPDKCTITYAVFLPDGNSLKITNQFGNTQLGDYGGRLEIDEKFGDFNAGVVKAIDTLNIEQGSIYITKLYAGRLTANGFGDVKIDTVSGDVQCHFTSGKMSFIGLINGHYNFTMHSKNVQALNFNLAKSFSANIFVNTLLSRLSNQSSLTFLEDTTGKARVGTNGYKALMLSNSPARKDSVTVLRFADTTKIQTLRKKLVTVFLSKQPVEYHSVSGDSTANININVAFGVVNFKQE